MKKLKILFIAIILFASFGCAKKEIKNDALDFKMEYEKLNGAIREKDGKEIRSIKIDEENPFIYSNADEIVEKISNKETFVIYFGFNDCPWCRSVLPTFLEVLRDLAIEKVYYVDIKDIRDTFEVVDKKAKRTVEGTKGYYELLKLLDPVLDDYLITDKNGKKIGTYEKRIYAPNIVVVKDGKALKNVTGISEDQDDAYMELSEEMIEESYEKIKCALDCVYDDKVCDKTC